MHFEPQALGKDAGSQERSGPGGAVPRRRGSGRLTLSATARRLALPAAVLLLTVGVGAAAGAAPRDGRGEGAVRGCHPERFAHCRGAMLSLADLTAADLRGADLRGADLNGALLHSASLAGADLRGADLRATTLIAANLRAARLRKANLADANLAFARVSRRQLADAYLCNTRLANGRIARRDCERPAPLQPKPQRARIAVHAAMAAPAPRINPDARPLRGRPRAGARSHRARRAAPRPTARRKVLLRVRVVGSGGVRSADGKLRCPGRCSARLPVGSRVSLIASPLDGATFAGWLGACRGSGRCTLVARGNRRVVAMFAARSGPAPPPSGDSGSAPGTGSGTAGSPLSLNCAPGQDDDADGIPDCVEQAGWNLAVVTPQDLGGGGAPVIRHVDSDPQRADSDNDGLSDGDELRFNADPRAADSDNDGLDDRAEMVTYRSLPNNADSDGDSLPAGGGARDPRLFDGNEVRDLKTSPRLSDTDGDGLSDRVEVGEERTNPRLLNLPGVSLVAVPGLSNPRFDLDYTVSQTTGTEQQHASSVQESNSATESTQTSESETRTTQNQWEAGASCTFEVAKAGCTVESKYTRTETDAKTRGTTVGFSNTSSTTQAASTVLSTSAQRQVTLGPTGCMQVPLRISNTGSVSVSVGNLQVLALTPDRFDASGSELLATLLPINGPVVNSSCPATAPGFGPVELPPGDSADVVFGQVVNSKTLLDYMAEPTPIEFRFGAINMTGTNLDGAKVDFLGEGATKALDRSATVKVNYPDGTVHVFQVAAASRFEEDGTPTGVTLGEALGPELGDLRPEYTSGTPTKLRALLNPDSGEMVANNESDPRQGIWNVLGSAEGIGDETVDWPDIVLRPGDTVVLTYAKDTDGDKLTDAFESEIGTDPSVADTDGDGLDDFKEAREGWTVPFARGNQSEYKAFSSPISCDADGDGSPDGPGPGNERFGACPTGQGPESARHTDATRADTNGDGLLDGEQPLPDALREVPLGGRMPELIRVWGGPGELGSGAAPFGIAVDGNQPIFDGEGQAAPLDSYVIVDWPPPTPDEVVTFRGNPRVSAPARKPGGFIPGNGDFPGNGSSLVPTATGIAVAPGRVGSGENAGSPVVVNYYAKRNTSVTDVNAGTAAITTFNPTTGQDLFAGGSVVSGAYGGLCCFSPPGLDPNGLATNGSGWLDMAGPHSVIVAHGAGKSVSINRSYPGSLPTRYFGVGDPEVDMTMRYGEKPPAGAVRAVEAPGRLWDPSGIAVDRSGNRLYVADHISGDASDPEDERMNGSITRFNLASGAPEAYLFVEGDKLAELHGMAVDPQGKYVYVGSDRCGVVYKLSSSLGILGAIGGEPCEALTPSSQMFEHPNDVDVDPGGGLWILDGGSELMYFFYYPFGAD